MTPKAKAVIIARVSSKGQENEGYSLESQVRLLQSYCESKNLAVAETFKIAESATKASQRRIFKEAMKFIEDNKIKHLIVEKVDRHVRNLQDAVETHDWLMADEDKQVHFVKDTLIMHKNSRSQEWLNWGIRVVMAKNYIDNLREEAMKGWAEKLTQGWLPGVPPPGYMTITSGGKRIHVPNPDTKQAIHKAFKTYLEPSHTIQSIAELMDTLGVRTRNGKPYSKSNVQKMLCNPFYIGINRHNGKDYPGVQEVFITKGLFDKVQVKMKRRRPSRYLHHNPVFKNMIQCGVCGGVVTWQLQKGRFYGTCQRSNDVCKKRRLLREDRLEEEIMEMLRKLVCPSPEVIQWVADTMRGQHHDKVEEKERLWKSIKTQVDRITRMDETLYDDKLAGDISQEKYLEKHTEFNKQKEELEVRLSKIDVSLGNRLDQTLVLLELSQKAAEIFPKKTPEQKRLIITKLFDNLSYGSNSVSVGFTKFTQTIANNVAENHKFIGGKK